MRIDEFDYSLPPELIAQAPVEQRDESRLLVIGAAAAGEPPRHCRFRQLAELLIPGDLLVVNDARVLPARVGACRATGGHVELLFVAPVPDNSRQWHVLAKPSRRVREGDWLTIDDDVAVRVVACGERGERRVELPVDCMVTDLLERSGSMPLPPYIHPEDSAQRQRFDRRRYQTVYAVTPGAVAAPTAGLHFSEALLTRLQARGVGVVHLTLHVGPGTFRPVACDNAEDHVMDAERYCIPETAATAVERAKAEHRRVIAVGTTAVRSLEHRARENGAVTAGPGQADLYIRPGFRFRVIDGMITNFHLPRSTPILLVSALIGRQRLLAAYREAVERGYRFYSYGDAMLCMATRKPQ